MSNINFTNLNFTNLNFTKEQFESLSDSEKKAVLKTYNELYNIEKSATRKVISNTIKLDEGLLVKSITENNVNASAAFITGIPIMIINRGE